MREILLRTSATRAVRGRSLIAAAAALIAGLTGALAPATAQAAVPYCSVNPCPVPTAFPVRGIDTSRWQHSSLPGKSGPAIDWFAVRTAGIRFAFVKATQGTSYVDPWFTTDFASARTANVSVSPYHFWDQAAGSGSAQASHFIAQLRAAGYTGARPGELAPMLDLEGCPSQTTLANVTAFLTAVKAAFGLNPFIYTSVGEFTSCLPSGSNLSAYPLFTARWGAAAPAPLPAGKWTNWTFWQFTDYASISGVPLRVDEDVYQYTARDLDCAANRIVC